MNVFYYLALPVKGYILVMQFTDGHCKLILFYMYHLCMLIIIRQRVEFSTQSKNKRMYGCDYY